MLEYEFNSLTYFGCVAIKQKASVFDEMGKSISPDRPHRTYISAPAHIRQTYPGSTEYEIRRLPNKLSEQDKTVPIKKDLTKIHYRIVDGSFIDAAIVKNKKELAIAAKDFGIGVIYNKSDKLLYSVKFNKITAILAKNKTGEKWSSDVWGEHIVDKSEYLRELCQGIDTKSACNASSADIPAMGRTHIDETKKLKILM